MPKTVGCAGPWHNTDPKNRERRAVPVVEGTRRAAEKQNLEAWVGQSTSMLSSHPKRDLAEGLEERSHRGWPPTHSSSRRGATRPSCIPAITEERHQERKSSMHAAMRMRPRKEKACRAMPCSCRAKIASVLRVRVAGPKTPRWTPAGRGRWRPRSTVN
jgi:hypothetical protein